MQRIALQVKELEEKPRPPRWSFQKPRWQHLEDPPASRRVKEREHAQLLEPLNATRGGGTKAMNFQREGISRFNDPRPTVEEVSGDSQALRMVSQLLESSDFHTGVNEALALACQCGNVFKNDSMCCRLCGEKRPTVVTKTRLSKLGHLLEADHMPKEDMGDVQAAPPTPPVVLGLHGKQTLKDLGFTRSKWR